MPRPSLRVIGEGGPERSERPGGVSGRDETQPSPDSRSASPPREPSAPRLAPSIRRRARVHFIGF